MSKRIIVLLSSYNGEKYIREQIDSIINQRGVDLTLLIRDDGSNDSTPSILRSYKEHNQQIEVVFGKNVGSARSFLLLMKEALNREDEFDYISLSDQDDYWMEDKLSKAVAKLELLPQELPAIYFSNLYIVDDKLSNKKIMYGDLENCFSVPHLMIESFATGCTMLYNKRALESFLMHPINNLRVHDIRLFHMCLFLGNYVYDNDAHILYRQHENNVIGANFYRGQRLRSKLRSLGSFWEQHVREDEAREVLFSYGDEMSEDDKEIVNVVANFRNNIKNRLILLFAPGHYQFHMRRSVDTFWFKIRVLLGVV